MHTYYRSSRRSGDSVPLTRYCPLDLYSGVTSCVEKAIEALWDGWVDSAGSANNLRLFVQGEMIKPDHVREHHVIRVTRYNLGSGIDGSP